MKLYIQALFLCVALFVYVAAEAEEREVEDENELEFLAPQEERGCKGVMSPCKEDITPLQEVQVLVRQNRLLLMQIPMLVIMILNK
uniref:U8-Deinotoxin-Dsu1e_1 n=1 Tax=Deinopis subrufa TaxID=1905329 RepID=A0A4Q8K1E0_DEISU